MPGRGFGRRGGASFGRRMVRRAAIVVVVKNGHRYAREYDNSKDGYTNYPIQENNGREYYTKDNKNYDVTSGEEISEKEEVEE